MASEETDPAVYTPERAAGRLYESGFSDEVWQEMVDRGLASHTLRAYAKIALGGIPRNIDEVIDEANGNDPHGPARKKYILESLD